MSFAAVGFAPDMTSKSRLPAELCDYILDYLSPPRSVFRARVPDSDAHLHTLLACARVCHGWNPRVRTHLYAAICLSFPGAMWKLISTFIRNPTTLCLVHSVSAELSPSVPFDRRGHEYFPLLLLLAIHSRLEKLKIDKLVWTAELYPLAHTARLGFRTSVVNLEISDVTFSSLSELHALLRSFRNLATLSLSGVTYQDDIALPPGTGFEEQWGHYNTDSLRTLEFTRLAVPAPRIFARNVEEFSLFERVDGLVIHLLSAEYLEPISSHLNLRTLRIALQFQPTCGMQEGTIAEREHAWGSVHDYLVSLLNAVRSLTLHSLHLSLIPHTTRTPHAEASQRWGARRSSFSVQYQHTRVGLLDAIFDDAIRDFLVGSPTFANLSLLEFTFEESSPVHHAQWWRPQIEKRLRGVRPGVVRVVLDPGNPKEDVNREGLWEDTLISAGTLLAA